MSKNTINNANNQQNSATGMPYNDFGSWIRRKFPFRVQKISVDGGFSCPNRDGLLSYGGCSFCDNTTFSPGYCRTDRPVSQQIDEGKSFFARKYPDMRYLAYFQSYSNTYAPLDTLRRRYEEALGCDGVVGIVIGTRPDCISPQVLDYLEQLSSQTFVIVEYGIESTDDGVLRRINRGHDFQCARDAIRLTAERGITTGGHIIIGLPGERLGVSEQAERISATRLDILKLHQLQIIRGTRMAAEYEREPFHVFSCDEYIRFIGEYISSLRPSMVLERFVSQSPRGMVVAPDWGLKNYEFTNRLAGYLKRQGIWQGKRFEISQDASM